MHGRIFYGLNRLEVGISAEDVPESFQADSEASIASQYHLEQRLLTTTGSPIPIYD
jgi:hypothetical protein